MQALIRNIKDAIKLVQDSGVTEIVFLVSQRRLAKTSEHLEKLFEDQYKPSTTA